jgi:hypothetical protein
MDDQQVGSLRVKNGILQIKHGGRWVVARRYHPEDLMWRALIEMNNRVESLEHTLRQLCGEPDR